MSAATIRPIVYTPVCAECLTLWRPNWRPEMCRGCPLVEGQRRLAEENTRERRNRNEGERSVSTV